MLGHLVGYVGFHAGLWLMEKFNTGFILGEFKGYVGPMLALCCAHVGSFGSFYGVPWRSLGRKKKVHKKSTFCEGFFPHLPGEGC